MARRAGPVDEQRLGRAANAGAPHLGVHDDLPRHFKVGARVDINVADTLQMREDRNARLLLHASDKASAAARHDHVERAVEAAQHGADRRAVRRRDKLDRMLRQAGGAKPRNERGMDGGVAAVGIGAAAQHGGVAGLQAQRARIRRHVGPALEDDADDAKRRAHPLDMKPVGAVPFRDDGTDRVRQIGDFLKRFRDRFEARFVQRAAVDHRPGRAGGLHAGDVSPVGGKDSRPAPPQFAGGCMERRILRLGRGIGEMRGGCLRRDPDALHQRLDVACLARRILAAPGVHASLSTMSSRWIIAERPR